MTHCRATPDGYRTDQHFDNCGNPHCRGCYPCVPQTPTGNPLHHCTARPRCSEHIEPGTRTCPRCIARTRTTLRRIATLTPLLPAAAIESGTIEGNAFNLAGPTADPAGWRTRQTHAAINGNETLTEDDPAHPYAVLGRWELTIREHYHQPDSHWPSVTRAAAYLDAHLARTAQDPTIDFPALYAETTRCLTRVETALAVAQHREVGAPCPACAVALDDTPPRLVMHRSNTDHSGASDTWRCPATNTHKWTEAEYRKWVSDDYLANSDRLTAPQILHQYRIPPGTLRQWVARGHLKQRGRDHRGRVLYDVTQALHLRDKTA